tara:strand:+ start:5149 stop:5469 length:321 start_codon:yes stop_codon:yes gene_type:complete
MYKLAFFVPESYKELVKQAVFAQGAGRYEAYDCCSWEALGTGQFKALSGSQPFIGEQDKLEIVAEYRVEMICAADKIKAVLQALIDSHPYETPAYEVWSIKTLDDF